MSNSKPFTSYLVYSFGIALANFLSTSSLKSAILEIMTGEIWFYFLLAISFTKP